MTGLPGKAAVIGIPLVGARNYNYYYVPVPTMQLLCSLRTFCTWLIMLYMAAKVHDNPRPVWFWLQFQRGRLEGPRHLLRRMAACEIQVMLSIQVFSSGDLPKRSTRFDANMIYETRVEWSSILYARIICSPRSVFPCQPCARTHAQHNTISR